MGLRFTGSIEELRDKLQVLGGLGEWNQLNTNQWQFRQPDGGILNWFPSTGTISFQGTTSGKSRLEQVVTGALTASGNKAPESGVVPPYNNPATHAGPQSDPTPLAPSVGQPSELLLGQKFDQSELVIGLVGAVGTELRKVVGILVDRLKVIGYTATEIHVSTDVIPKAVRLPEGGPRADEFERIESLMDAGNRARELSGDNSILALGVAANISSRREEGGKHVHRPRHAYIVSSLKHPREVERLREIYPEAFYLIGVHADEKRRHRHLTEEKRLSSEDAEKLIRRDEDEHVAHGQRTTDTFHMSDFFVHLDENQDKLKYSIWRILHVLFGNPYITPTFDEFAMFMAFGASLRSADLSRQVGAVITKHRMIIATGANDCPQYGGGLYWPEYDSDSSMIEDARDGRDYKRGEDSNKIEQAKIINRIVEHLGPKVDPASLREAVAQSGIVDITEYGRVVHAEMEALLSCSRTNISTHEAELYCTTFPCHNCAKHIVAAGILRVVYIEPYPKSKAAEFHTDSISIGISGSGRTVRFEPFVGVGPRRFFDLFSMKLGSGYPLKRKDGEGIVIPWQPEGAKLRIQMIPSPYMELELVASSMFNTLRKRSLSDGQN